VYSSPTSNQANRRHTRQMCNATREIERQDNGNTIQQTHPRQCPSLRREREGRCPEVSARQAERYASTWYRVPAYGHSACSLDRSVKQASLLDHSTSAGRRAKEQMRRCSLELFCIFSHLLDQHSNSHVVTSVVV